MRMEFTELKTLLKKENSISGKYHVFLKAINDYIKIKIGILFGAIYHEIENQDNEFQKFFNKVTEDDLKFFNELFNSDVKKFLSETTLESKLDFNKGLGTKQIGFNTISVENPKSLWTTGRANFFIPTKKNVKNKIILKIASVTPLRIKIGFEKNIIKSFDMKSWSKQEIEFTIDPKKVTSNVSEIFIITDKMWKPGYAEGKKKSCSSWGSY